MRATRASTLCVIAVALAACRTGLLTLDEDAGVGLADASLPCASQHTYEAVPLLRIEQVDATALRLGRAVRVRVVYALRAYCDVPANVDMTLAASMSSLADVHVVAHDWRATDATGCGEIVEHSRVLVVSDLGLDTPAGVEVIDQAPGATARATFPFVGTAMPSSATVDGGICTADVDCEASDAAARCIPANPKFGYCRRPCNESVECGGQSCVDDACVTAAPACQTDRDCGFGQRCESANCVAAQPGMPDAPCACDGACGFGGVCARTEDLSFCRLPCQSTADCRSPLRCIDGACTG